MDPVTIGAVVLAIASGAAGEVGAKLWDGLVTLVRRPFSRQSALSGVRELAALEQAPDMQGGVELAKALVARSEVDAAWRQDFDRWLQQAVAVSVEAGSVMNTISGGTQRGPVFQGRDFTGINLNSGSQPPSG